MAPLSSSEGATIDVTPYNIQRNSPLANVCRFFSKKWVNFASLIYATKEGK
jgi:hypothetical protein